MTVSALEENEDYHCRFQEFRLAENQRDALVEEVLAKLNAVTLQRDEVTRERAREVSVLEADLESEKEARRGWQDKAGTLREKLMGMEQARFVLVLLDADADIYLFHEKFLSRGLQGGQTAADKFMEKVREHLLSLGDSIEDAKSVPVMVKAYANLSGLAQACVRDKRLASIVDMVQFWIGFSRRYPLVDFVDVGYGKEEADNKLREVLRFHTGNPQCRHILLGYYNDGGYVPVLRQYAAQSSVSERITLLSAGPVRPDMESLGFRVTSIFKQLFTPPKVSSSGPSFSTQGRNGPQSPTSVQQAVDTIVATSSSTTEKSLSNSSRLGPIIRNSAGKRVDKGLIVNESLVNVMKKHNLCTWHYLRADCTKVLCPRNHKYPRPLSLAEFDAQWCISRQGMCFHLRKGADCNDDQCMYSHGVS